MTDIQGAIPAEGNRRPAIQPPGLVTAKFPSDAPTIGAVAVASDAIPADGNRTDGRSVNLFPVMLSEGMPT